MASYRRNNPENRLEFVDISGEDFQPGAYGKSLGEFMSELHVRDANGNYYTGIDAFIAIWQAFPSGSLWRFAAALLGMPGINSVGRGGYRVFARYRHLLPKGNQECRAGTCDPDRDITNKATGGR